MLRNHIMVAVRNLLRHKGYSLIHVSGLAIGMACCLLMFLLVRDELSYDRHHVNRDRIYRVTSKWRNPQTGQTGSGALGPYRLADALRTDFPELEVVRFARRTERIRRGEKRFRETRFFLAEPNVFSVFTFPLAKGDPNTALRDPASVVITQAMAEKYFGAEDPMGKVLRAGVDREMTVTGVLDDLPVNVHFRFDFLGSMSAATTVFNRLMLENWGEGSVYTYVMLRKGVSPGEMEAQLPAFVAKHRGEEAVERYGAGLTLMPLTDIHLRSHTRTEIEPNGDIAYVYGFSAIAFAVLLIACINFMNLATARSTGRASEVGLRKVVGAFRTQIVRQFLGESVLLAAFAVLLAVALAGLALPWFNEFVEKDLSVDLTQDAGVGSGLAVITLFVGVVAGSYPALFLSQFRPVEVLRGGLRPRWQGIGLRQVLVVFQFAVTVFLIIVTGIIHDQLEYTRQIKLGYETDRVLVLPGIPSRHRRSFETLKQEWMAHRGVTNVALTSRIPSGRLGSNIRPFPEGIPQDEAPSMQTVWVGYGLFELLGMQFAAGRGFSIDHPADASSAFVINEAACRALGWTPGEAIAKKFGSSYIDDWSEGQWKRKDGQVIGVVEDVYYEPLHERVKPMVFFIEPYMAWQTLVSIRGDDVADTVGFLREKYRELDAEAYQDFSFTFLDERFDRLYRAEEKQAQVFGAFAMLAVFVGCLGLLGLAAYTADRRSREISIRKVLGASVHGLVVLLSGGFAKLVAIAILIAWPLAYYAMSGWLQGFAYHTDLSPVTFVVGGLLALGIALVTVSSQAVRASLSNPADVLRNQ